MEIKLRQTNNTVKRKSNKFLISKVDDTSKIFLVNILLYNSYIVNYNQPSTLAEAEAASSRDRFGSAP